MRLSLLSNLLLVWVCAFPSSDGAPESFVISMVDGHVETIDAWTGELRGVFSAEPLIQASVPPDSILDSDHFVVVPGFDGTLYWIEHAGPHSSPPDTDLRAVKLPLNALEITDEPCTLCTEHREDQEPHDISSASRRNTFKFSSNPGDVPSSPEANMSDEADEDLNSVSNKGRECGLVVGERSSTIFALDAETGGVRWIKDTHTGRHANFDVNIHAESTTEPQSQLVEDEPMLLQRDKYTVRYTTVADGTELWNVSVALFSTVELSRPRSLARLFKNSPKMRQHLSLTSYEDGNQYASSNDFDDFDNLNIDYNDLQSLGAVSLPRLQLIPLDESETEGYDYLYRLEAIDRGDNNLLWYRNLTEREAVSSIYGVWCGLWVNIDPRASSPFKKTERSDSISVSSDDAHQEPTTETSHVNNRDGVKFDEKLPHVTAELDILLKQMNVMNINKNDDVLVGEKGVQENNDDMYADKAALVSYSRQATPKPHASGNVFKSAGYGKVKWSPNLVYILPGEPSNPSTDSSIKAPQNGRLNLPPPSTVDHLYPISDNMFSESTHQRSSTLRAMQATRSATAAMSGFSSPSSQLPALKSGQGQSITTHGSNEVITSRALLAYSTEKEVPLRGVDVRHKATPSSQHALSPNQLKEKGLYKNEGESESTMVDNSMRSANKRSRGPSPWISSPTTEQAAILYNSGTATAMSLTGYHNNQDFGSGLLLSWRAVLLIGLLVIALSGIIAWSAFKFGRKKTILESPAPSPKLSAMDDEAYKLYQQSFQSMSGESQPFNLNDTRSYKDVLTGGIKEGSVQEDSVGKGILRGEAEVKMLTSGGVFRSPSKKANSCDMVLESNSGSIQLPPKIKRSSSSSVSPKLRSQPQITRSPNMKSQKSQTPRTSPSSLHSSPRQRSSSKSSPSSPKKKFSPSHHQPDQVADSLLLKASPRPKPQSSNSPDFLPPPMYELEDAVSFDVKEVERSNQTSKSTASHSTSSHDSNENTTKATNSMTNTNNTGISTKHGRSSYLLPPSINTSHNLSKDQPVEGISADIEGRWSIQQRYKNEFEQQRQLGQGGFGAVYQAKNRLDGHDYAIKKVRLSSKQPKKIEKVLREVRILAQLDSKHIIRYYQAWIEPITVGEQEEMIRDKQNGVNADELGGNTTTGDMTTTNNSISSLGTSMRGHRKQWSDDGSFSMENSHSTRSGRRKRRNNSHYMSSREGQSRNNHLHHYPASSEHDEESLSGWAALEEYKGDGASTIDAGSESGDSISLGGSFAVGADSDGIHIKGRSGGGGFDDFSLDGDEFGDRSSLSSTLSSRSEGGSTVGSLVAPSISGGVNSGSVVSGFFGLARGLHRNNSSTGSGTSLASLTEDMPLDQTQVEVAESSKPLSLLSSDESVNTASSKRFQSSNVWISPSLMRRRMMEQAAAAAAANGNIQDESEGIKPDTAAYQSSPSPPPPPSQSLTPPSPGRLTALRLMQESPKRSMLPSPTCNHKVVDSIQKAQLNMTESFAPKCVGNEVRAKSASFNENDTEIISGDEDWPKDKDNNSSPVPSFKESKLVRRFPVWRGEDDESDGGSEGSWSEDEHDYWCGINQGKERYYEQMCEEGMEHGLFEVNENDMSDSDSVNSDGDSTSSDSEDSTDSDEVENNTKHDEDGDSMKHVLSPQTSSTSPSLSPTFTPSYFASSSSSSLSTVLSPLNNANDMHEKASQQIKDKVLEDQPTNITKDESMESSDCLKDIPASVKHQYAVNAKNETIDPTKKTELHVKTRVVDKSQKKKSHDLDANCQTLSSDDFSKSSSDRSVSKDVFYNSSPLSLSKMRSSLNHAKSQSQNSSTSRRLHEKRHHYHKKSNGHRKTDSTHEFPSMKKSKRKGGSYDLWLYIQMQYCSNNTLRDHLDSRDSVDIAHALHIFVQIARGLAYVHGKDMIHRDLKPSNCFFMGDGTVKVGDFGLSRSAVENMKRQGSTGSVTSRLNQSIADELGLDGDDYDDDCSPPPTPQLGPIQASSGYDNSMNSQSTSRFSQHGHNNSITSGVGTMMYASPEQIEGGDYNAKTDIYSLGIMLFELCHPAFSTGMERAIVFRNLQRQLLPQDWPVSKSHPPLAELLLSMLHKDANKRPDSQQVVRAILTLQAPGPVVLSLDNDRGNASGNIVLRVEVDLMQLISDSAPDVKSTPLSGVGGSLLPPSPPIDPSTEALQQIRSKIMSAASNARIDQYGLRESPNNQTAVMEFLLSNLDERGSSAVSKAVKALTFVREVRLV